MSNDFSNILNSLSYSKENLMENEIIEEDAYVPFVINQIFSRHEDCILYVNEMNKLHDTSKRMQYDFFLHSFRKRKRFAKSDKPEKDNLLDMISTYYQINPNLAKTYKKLLSSGELEIIQKSFDTGGLQKK